MTTSNAGGTLRKDGRWVVRRMIVCADGSKQRKSFYGATREKAIEYARQHEEAQRAATSKAIATKKRDFRKRCSIYFMLAHLDVPRVKIGVSAKVTSRLKELQTGCPAKIELLYACPAHFELEKIIHRRLNHLREHGEWFRDDPELRAFVKALKWLVEGEPGSLPESDE